MHDLCVQQAHSSNLKQKCLPSVEVIRRRFLDILTMSTLLDYCQIIVRKLSSTSLLPCLHWGVLAARIHDLALVREGSGPRRNTPRFFPPRRVELGSHALHPLKCPLVGRRRAILQHTSLCKQRCACADAEDPGSSRAGSLRSLLDPLKQVRVLHLSSCASST